MKVAAVVPYKRFTRAKRRLRSRYPDADVEALGRAMLDDVLAALVAAPHLDRVWVLTDDAEVERAARSAGAEVRIERPDPGLNPVVEAAWRELAQAGFDAALTVLGDLPLLRTTDVEAVLEAGETESVVIVPASDGGTAMLLCRPPGVIPAHFGPASAEAHLRAARARGIEPAAVSGLAEASRLDLDTPEDADRLLDTQAPGRTLALLRRLARTPGVDP